MIIKTRIKELRAKYNLTQDELADRVGVSRQTLLYLEKGKYNPSLLLAYKVAGALNSIIEDVFTIDDYDKGFVCNTCKNSYNRRGCELPRSFMYGKIQAAKEDYSWARLMWVSRVSQFASSCSGRLLLSQCQDVTPIPSNACQLGGYHISDIEFTAAIDIDYQKSVKTSLIYLSSQQHL
jgi:DNA-binding XRE family transcriptional regulator